MKLLRRGRGQTSMRCPQARRASAPEPSKALPGNGAKVANNSSTNTRALYLN